MNKFEKLIEYIINEDEAKAKALFHKIVVEKSRDIYESLVDEDQFPVQRGRGAESLGQEIEGHNDVINGDEIGEAEGDEFGGEDDFSGDDEFGGEEGGIPGEGEDDFGGEGDDFGGEEGGIPGEGEEGLEDRVMDLEDAIDELKSEFDRLMAGEEEEEEQFPGIHGEEGIDGDEGEGDEFGGDEGVGQDELDDDADGEGENKFGEASIYGGQGNSKTVGEAKAKKDLKKAPEKKEKKTVDKKTEKEVKEGRKSPADLMREYVEKVGQDWGKNFPAEGDPVGSGGTKSPVNTKSVQINGKNDMGGTTANIAQGKFASDRDSNNGPKKPSNAYTKGETKMGQDKYENSPAANTKGYKDKRTVKREQEGQTTDGSVPVVKKSFNPGGKPGFKG